MRQFVMTDIHGCNKTFNALLNEIAFTTDDELYLLGDYIDRGPDSKGVIDTILNLIDKGHKVHCLMGNHELMLLDAIRRDSPSAYRFWAVNGGEETLSSFKCAHARDIPEIYIDFFKKLKYYAETGPFILVHAGLGFSPSNPNPLDLTEDSNLHHLVWRRDWYGSIDYEWLGNRYILHGHTPIFQDQFFKGIIGIETNRYLNLDTGCVFPEAGMGILTCIEMNNGDLATMNYME